MLGSSQIVFSGLRQVGLYAALATGCASWLPAPVPMRTLASPEQPGKQARCLLVLLPGLGDSEKDFRGRGFIDAIRTRNLPIDVISANATLGYYARRTLRPRLEADILAAAQKAGYEQIWFGGISMGGMGSLLMAQSHPRELAGVILIAPYLGDDDVIDEVAGAGGLAAWKPPAEIDKDDYQRELWSFLKGAIESPASAPPIYLLSGDQDKFAKAHRLVGAHLPPERRFRTRGSHDWGPWKILWTDFLDNSDFRSQCSR